MPYTSDTAPEQLLQAPGAHPWKASWVHPGEPAFGERAQATQEGLMNQTVQALPSRQGDKAVEQANDIYQQSMQRLAKRQTNGTDLTAVQTRKATPETPKYTSAVDIFKQYATKPDDGPEQQALDYAQTHRGLYAVTDFVASLANVIFAAHGATPQQMTSLSAANGQRIQQLRQIQEARRQRYEQGLMSAALSDAQYNNQREERLRQEAREDEYRKQSFEFQRQQAAQQQANTEASQALSREKMAQDESQFQRQQARLAADAERDAQIREDYYNGQLNKDRAGTQPKWEYHYVDGRRLGVNTTVFNQNAEYIKGLIREGLPDEQRRAMDTELANAKTFGKSELGVVMSYAQRNQNIWNYFLESFTDYTPTSADPTDMAEGEKTGEDPVYDNVGGTSFRDNAFRRQLDSLTSKYSQYDITKQ